MKRSIALAAVAFALLSGCGKGGSSGSSSGSSGSGTPVAAKSPQEAWEAARKFLAAGDAKGVWGLLSESSRKSIMEGEKPNMEAVQKLEGEALASEARERGVTTDALRKASLEDYCIMNFGMRLKDETERKKQEGSKWKEAKINGEKAVAVSILADGTEEKTALVKEGGAWKVDIEESAKLGADK
jgi:hypothetical protein